MEKFYPFFPLSVHVLPDVPKTLILSIVIYLIICAVLGVLQSILGWIPIVGWIVDVVCSLLGLYCVGGIILSVLKYFQTNEV